MNTKKIIVMSLTAALILTLSAFANCGKCDMNEPKKCDMDKMPMECRLISAAPIYLDSPSVLYGQAEKLGLTAEQKEQLQQIQLESRQKALAVLTDEQKEKLGSIQTEPVILSKICKEGKCGFKKDAQTCPMTQKAQTCPMMQKAQTKAAAEQTICPVMGGKINKDIYTEYKGKKVYFCCPDCKAAFAKDTEKYLDKLPQFKK